MKITQTAILINILSTMAYAQFESTSTIDPQLTIMQHQRTQLQNDMDELATRQQILNGLTISLQEWVDAINAFQWTNTSELITAETQLKELSSEIAANPSIAEGKSSDMMDHFQALMRGHPLMSDEYLDTISKGEDARMLSVGVRFEDRDVKKDIMRTIDSVYETMNAARVSLNVSCRDKPLYISIGTNTSDYAAAITECLKQYDRAQFNALQDHIAGSIQGVKTNLDVRLASVNDQLKAKQTARDDVEAKLLSWQNRRVAIDELLIRYALPAFGILVCIILLVPKRYTDPALQRSIFESGIILHVITVFLLVAAIMILGLSGKIPGEVLGTLLGGIAGYVLGRNASEKR